MAILLPRNIQKQLKGHNWYHQRFDGAPMYMAFVGEAEVKKEKRKPAGTEADVRVCFFQKGRADWYLDMKDITRGAKVVVNLAKKDSNISPKLLNAWIKDERTFQKFFDEFPRVKLRHMADKELLTFFNHYYKLAIKRFTSSAIIDHFALGTDELIAGRLKKEIGKIKKESDFTEIFSIATAPVRQSFINKAEMELLKIAIESPSSKRKIDEYQKKFFWIRNNYFNSYVLAPSYFRQEIKRWLKSAVDLRAKYKQIQEISKKNTKRKVQFLEQYQLSRHLRTLLEISEDFTWWQDERKKATFLNIYLGEKILSEIAQRISYPQKLMKYLLPIEIKTIFKQDVPTIVDLRKREKSCAVVFGRKGNTVLVGQEAKNLRRLMFTSKKKDIVNDIRGLSASVGKITGTVKIVKSVQEIKKIKKGDILITVMTRPDYMIGIKKAVAIVTNEGGITCHAAIVSREFGIPCIIGTKIATEVFKDGDLVEVDANHGVVRKIRT